MGLEYLGLDAVGWHRMVSTWWDKVIAACLLTTIVFGAVYILAVIGRKIYKVWQGRHQLSEVPTAIARYFDQLKTKNAPLAAEKSAAKELKSFGVFLGGFSNPPTPAEASLLAQWDILVVDPLQSGVRDALAGHCTSSHILARLDVQSLVRSDASRDNDEVLQALGVVVQTLGTALNRGQGGASPFHGVLLADCIAHFQPVVLNELVQYMNHLGLAVWLELSPPDFLSEQQGRAIDMKQIRGVVYRNGTILPDGDRRNYFQMAEMRTAMRAVASQKAVGDSAIAMWDTIDDDVELSHHVLGRSFKWCNYNSALCWIAPHAALTNADIAVVKTVTQEPLGAMMWLKRGEVLEAHDVWRFNNRISQTPRGHEEVYDSLESFLPGVRAKLALSPPVKYPGTDSPGSAIHGLEWSGRTESPQTDILSTSPDGTSYTGLGCFQIGLHCTSKDIADLLESQRQVRDLDLLQRIQADELRQITEPLRVLLKAQSSYPHISLELQSVRDLVDLLTVCRGDENDRLRIYVGLHSGFRTRLGGQIWGLHDLEPGMGVLNIYLSGKTQDRTGTILHTYLANRGFTRSQCFLTEMALAAENQTLSQAWDLPQRMVDDVEQLTPAETLSWLRRLALSSRDDPVKMSAKLRACGEYQVLETPSLAQLRALNSSAYLDEEVSPEELIASRLAWFKDQGCWCPDPAAAEALFREVDARLPGLLMDGDADFLDQLTTVFQTILQKGKIDAGTDILALSVFCAFRRLALYEIYLEVLDRNPLPNLEPVQAACFAEMYACGARTDMYFDTTPKRLGQIIWRWYRAYYHKYQPPQREEAFTELPTAYASMNVDLDPDAKDTVPWHYRLTFLGIFAVPALIDVTMLTTVGRGLYLTTYMSDLDKTLATTALMIALLVCGGFGSWISSGGSYYLYAMAFPAMSMFVLTRFIAGLAVALVGGIIALIVVGVLKGFAAGILFFLYFVMLSTYLMTLSALSVYQLPGYQFQSGRSTIMACIPILFISPIVTLWVHRDSVIYLCILGLFLANLLLGARRVISRWNRWYLNIPCVTDTEVVNWYMQTQGSSYTGSSTEKVKDVGADARQALLASVHKENKKWVWSKKTTDPFVAKMADGYSATTFLLGWYCRYSRTKMPLAYSPTWNLQLKAAVDTMAEMQKGLKMHNAFLHWRHTGSDVWCGILYFVVALSDKWSALLTGESIVGLSAANSAKYRLTVGFALGYYLLGAVILDAVSQPLWTLVHKATPQPVSSLASLREVTLNDAKDRRRLYWRSLMKFFFLHIWGAAVTMAIMWTFEGSMTSTIMYLCYVGCYSGLLWYQYNRIFTGPHVAGGLALSAIAGLVVGIVLHEVLPAFEYSSVIGLATGTWGAAFYSLFRSDIGLPSSKASTEESSQLDVQGKLLSHSVSTIEPHPDLSQATMCQMFDNILMLSDEFRYKLDPVQHPGVEVMQILRSDRQLWRSKLMQAAFPGAADLVRRIAELWQAEEITVELVSAAHLIQPEQKIRAISRRTGDQVHVFIVIGPDLVGYDWVSDIRRNCQTIAEAVVQATAEFKLGLSHDHSMMAELLVVNDQQGEDLSLPEGIKRQLESSSTERARVMNYGQHVVLRHLLLGMDCDQEWDHLPQAARFLLLRRACGQPCRVSTEQVAWLRSRACAGESLSIEEFIARSNLGVKLTVSVMSLAATLETHHQNQDEPEFMNSKYDKPIRNLLALTEHTPTIGFTEALRLSLARIVQIWHACIKFTVISLVADPEYQRELDSMLRGQPLIFAWPVNFMLNGVWICCKWLQRLIIPLVLLHGREKVSTLYRNMKDWKTVVYQDRVVVESLGGVSTGFFRTESDGTVQLYQYSGRHDHEPSDYNQLIAINTYTDNLVLSRRQEYHGETLLNEFTYQYSQDSRKGRSKLPTQRECTQGELSGQIVQYDKRGYMTAGSAMRGVNPVEFKFWYRKGAKFEDELLRADYVLPHIKIHVAWCMPPPNRPERQDKWIPYPRVTDATFTQGDDTHKAKWTYDHKFHPVIATTLNGESVATPAMIDEDWFKVLQKPNKCSFVDDNPLFSFSSIKANFVSRLLGLNVKRYPIPTSRARAHLWKSWKASKEFDAITARWLDELMLRSDRVLKAYWRKRDMGRLEAAADYLDAQADTVLARVDIDPEVSSWTPLAFKISDLSSFGQGGDSRINTRTLSTQLQDNDTELHVLAMDTGTWPNEPGGVSACRRDMVNDLKAIRWHILAEAANDFGVPRFQIERNVQSLTVLPQWGLDFMNPTHGMFQNTLDSEVVQKSHDTRVADIERNFIPILTSIVRCARTMHKTRAHIEEATKALCDLNTYFESTRNWNDVWMSDTVKRAWRELWLTEDMEDTIPVSEWWNCEHPTLQQLDAALDMWHRYLFIFSIPVPERIPDVFQVSHHFTGATYGVMCKVKRKCALHVWDHCVSFREMTTFLSAAVSFDSTFVNSTLISLGHLSCILIEHHADVVLPCAEYFNPGWEIELGTCEGVLEHRRAFHRKIDPVVNGITNMEKYKPIEKIKTETPTVVMLSHIRYVKDIKTAIMATDLIVNQWGFKDYRLHIYGDMERAPGYASECQEVIASKSLRDHVVLKGLGNPSVVLQDGWLFMNSSTSEGLPLAMGEAALTGVPVVCTDVGASFCVVMNRDTGKKFSEVVPPNDAFSLASAQIRVMALLGEWSKFAGDEEGYVPPSLGLRPSPEEVKQISQRMYEKVEQRRQFGMQGRDNVLKSFSSHRYLREHEQMLWLGKYQSQSYVARGSLASAGSSGFFKERVTIEQIQDPLLPPTPRWPGARRESRRGYFGYSSSSTQSLC
ncbi:glycosyltransferase family 4 protein [Aspergillus carbonarius ITEM 5010]|uniref:Glycosyltransferase family 4 protein n=1 Tax=Aspergillus carbonarius (strain ITEM 5010) TaxID=602072 RepID=A0A1R3RGH3_ASPC5|nr:glycosyltransferase family 4 protein [Aspergillus carbonarius ITEM 5010]